MIHLAIRGHDLSGEYTPKQLAQAVGAKKIKNVQFALNASFPDLSAPEKMNPGMGPSSRMNSKNKAFKSLC